MKLKVASYNIRKGLGTDRVRSPERILEVLREIDADVIALQEADQRFGKREAVLGHHLLDEHSDYKSITLARRPASMGWHGNALLVRKSATIEDCDALHIPALEPRGAVMAAVTTGRATVRVVGMHLDLSGLWRRKQAHAIIAHVDGCRDAHPTVLMGDLNEWTRASGCLRDFASRYAFANTGPSFHARVRSVGSTGSWCRPSSGSRTAASTPAPRRARRAITCRSGRRSPAHERGDRARTPAGIGLLRRHQPRGLHARHYQGGVASRAGECGDTRRRAPGGWQREGLRRTA